MEKNTEENLTPISEHDQNESGKSLDRDVISRFVQTQEIDLANLLPSQRETGLKLEDRQEITRSQLATFLIKILAGTLFASFSLIIVLVVMAGTIGEEKKETFNENSILVKDMITFMLTAQTGLIGTALGFYFGSRGNGLD
jgi:hypothetical protein